MSDLSKRQLMRDLQDLAGSLPTGAPARVEARLIEEIRKRRRRRYYVRALAAGVAFVALLIPVRRPAPRLAPMDLSTFVMLDDGPIDSGMVMRVRLLDDFGGATEVEADVLVGEDGRPHGVRLIQ
jgi:hypothetical protein